MAKRLTDTGKWDKAWFRKLPASYKCIWLFLCDRCDHAGVWEIDVDAFKYFIDFDVTLSEIVDRFGDKVEVFGDKLVVKGFIEFQYGDLNPENRVHKSVLNRLEKLAPYKPLKRTLKGPKDKDKDKDKDKLGECEGIYNAYPRKLGKAAGLKKLNAEVKAGVNPADIKAALDRFIAYHRNAKTEKDYLPYFSTWATNWRDWLDPEHGKSESFGQQKKSTLEVLKEALGGS